MQFPNITHVEQLQYEVGEQEEIRKMLLEEDIISFCYMIAAQDTFNTSWARECRGIVFNNKSGAVIGRPLHKFFNVNEREETLLSKVDWTKVVRVMDKRDGSMIHTVITPDGVRLKSKKSLTSDVAISATRWFNSEAGANVRSLCSHLADKNCTAIFEWTAPDARIVLYYPQEELRLLHVRHNVTGEYYSSESIKSLSAEFNIGVVDEPAFDVPKEKLGQHLVELAKTVEGIEGWIVQFEDGEMVKLKTEWYLKRHRTMTFLRERDIAELAISEQLDDIKSVLTGEGVNIDEIINIEARVLASLRELISRVELAFEQDKHLERKDFAIKNKEHLEFGLLMNKFSGKDPDFKGFFIKNLLKDQFSLRQLNLLQSIGEVE
jgi:RNA ligase